MEETMENNNIPLHNSRRVMNKYEKEKRKRKNNPRTTFESIQHDISKKYWNIPVEEQRYYNRIYKICILSVIIIVCAVFVILPRIG